VRAASTALLSVLMIVLGLIMLVTTLARGGGPLSVGVVFGLLFCLAGGARLYLERAR
jgi:hypothetical protein